MGASFVRPKPPEPTRRIGQDEFGYVPQNPGSVVIKGHAVFLNEVDSTEALADVWVLVWDADTLTCGLFNDLLWEGLAGGDGYFETPALDNSDECGTLDIYIEFRLETLNTVRVTTGGLFGGTYAATFPVSDDIGDGSFDVGNLRPEGADIEAAARMFHQISWHAYRFAASLGDDIGRVTVVYPWEDWPHYHPGAAEIHIPSGGDWDRAEDVIIHEHGHYVMDWAYGGFDPSPGGDHNVCGDGQDRGLAWSEGWATAWALMVFNDPAFTYPSGGALNYETPTDCDGVRAGPPHHDHSEYRVSAALWDIFDGGVETYDKFGPLGADKIWEALKDFNDVNYEDFYGSWRAEGFDPDVFLMTAYQNTIDYDTAPTVQVIDPNSPGWRHGTITVAASASDSDNSISYVDFWYSLDASTFVYLTRDISAPFSISWDTAGLSDLSVWVEANSFDGMKDSLPDLSDASFSIDNGLPVTTASLSGIAGQSGWFTSSVIVILTASDLLSGAVETRYQIDGDGWSRYTTPLSFSGDGAHEVEYFSIDEAGNIEPTHSDSVKIDATAPATFAQFSGSQGDNGWFKSLVTAVLTASDATSGLDLISYRLDGGPLETFTGPFTISGDGAHTLGFFARDSAGNIESANSMVVKIDMAPPEFIHASPSGTVTSSGVIVSWNAIDATSGIAHYEVSVDGAPFQSTGLNSSVVVSLSDGQHMVAVRAVDAAGNIVETDIRFSVDTSAFNLAEPSQRSAFYIILAGVFTAGVVGFLLSRRKRRKKARGEL